MRLPAALLLALIALCLTGCGPTDEEVGRAILLTAFVPHALGIALILALRKLWRPMRPGTPIQLNPMLIALIVLVAAAGLSLVDVTEKGPDHPDASGVDGVLDIAWIAMWAFGFSYLALWLIAWRIWFAKAPGTATTWSFLPVLALMIWPCPIMMGGGTTRWQDIFSILWVWPGYCGLVTGPVLIGLLIEIWVRRKRAANREAAE